MIKIGYRLLLLLLMVFGVVRSKIYSTPLPLAAVLDYFYTVNVTHAANQSRLITAIIIYILYILKMKNTKKQQQHIRCILTKHL